MSAIVGLLALKLITLVGATAATAAFIGLFAFKETLGPHVSMLFIGGFIATAVGEGASWFLGKWMASRQP